MSKTFQSLILAISKRFDYEEIEGLRDSVKGFARAREKSILKNINSLDPDQFENGRDLEDYRSHLESEAEFLVEVELLSNEMCILALYKKLEIATRKLVTKFYPKLNAGELHNIDYLKRNLPFDITALDEFASIDELRLINNSIKHQGVVSHALSSYPGWLEGQPLTDLGNAFERLAPKAEVYVEGLCEAIRANHD